MNAKQLPDRFYVDLAIGAAPFVDICRTYGLDPDQVSRMNADASFSQRLLQAKQSVEDDGRAFKARCRSVVHATIPRLRQLIENPDTPAAAAISAFNSLVKFSGLEPREDAPVVGGAQLSLTIIAPGGQRLVRSGGRMIEHQPIDIDLVDV
jgi:hypothetical protein